MKEQLSEKYLQSYCYTKFGNFMVSTIHRRSSATLAPDMWYYETLAWNLLPNGDRDKIIADNSGAHFETQARVQHSQVVEQLYEKGEFTYAN